MARAKQDRIDRPGTYTVLPVLIHGDAAFAGQGVVAETLNLSDLKGYRTGGTIHLVINNQLGFTTAPEFGRSSVYATDVAKMVQAPIFHVNGDDPEACVRVARLAFDFRQAFHKDVVIDMFCYRRHGHNEGDDPSYTQPLMYQRIDERRSVRKLYTEALVKRGDITLEEAEQALDDFSDQLAGRARRDPRAGAGRRAPRPAPAGAGRRAAARRDRRRPRRCSTGSSTRSTPSPEGFTVHPKLAEAVRDRGARCGERRRGRLGARRGARLRLARSPRAPTSASPARTRRRGTFSHRHAVLVDYETGRGVRAARPRRPRPGQVLDLRLARCPSTPRSASSTATRSCTSDALVCWEAQFGDFVNGAQIIIDQFLVAAEDKWGQTCGLVLLLPHGYEGQGPEHSSARIERFLTLCAEDNIQVANATTAAQYFHLLRRQVRRDVRKPLIVFTPKSLLRAKRVALAGRGAHRTARSRRCSTTRRSPATPSTVQRVVLALGQGRATTP